MDVDIEIEEHDLLDNPELQRIFPDLSSVKREVGYFEQGLEVEVSIQSFSPDSEISSETMQKMEYSHSFPDSSDSNADIKMKETSQDYPDASTAVSLGPNINCLDLEKLEVLTSLTKSKIILHDSKSYLNMSENYCGNCLILFSDKDSIDRHVNNNHDGLLNPKRLSTTELEQCSQDSTDSTRYYKCDICGRYVNSSHGCKLHMLKMHNVTVYSKEMTKVNFNPVCSFCGKHSASVHQYHIHLSKDHWDLMYKETKHFKSAHASVDQVKDAKIENYSIDNLIIDLTLPGNDNTLHAATEQPEFKPKINKLSNHMRFYKCDICGVFFANTGGYIKHMIKSHKIHEVPLLRKVDFDGVCVFCQKQCRSWFHYHSHVSRAHGDFLNKRVSNSNNAQENYPLQVDISRGNYCSVEDNDWANSFEHGQNTELLQNETLTIDYPLQAKVYRCDICWCYYDASLILESHLEHVHGFVIPSTLLKPVLFDSKCKFCSERKYEIFSYNDHLLSTHYNVISKTKNSSKEYSATVTNKLAEQNRCSTITGKIDKQKTCATNIDKLAHHKTVVNSETKRQKNSIKFDPSSLLKDIIFKCIKCDIHFLSAELATKHVDHMELLINWKCHSCSRIFKGCESSLHLKQHSYTKEFSVYEVNPELQCRVLFKCPKCAIHFNEKIYLKHNCEIEASTAVPCSICNFLIGDSIHVLHESFHINENLVLQDFLIIEAKLHIIDSQIEHCDNYYVKSVKTRGHLDDIVSKLNDGSDVDIEKILLGLIYTCMQCDTTVDSYDKVVEHCHGHYSLEEKPQERFICDICELKFDISCQERHKKKHDLYHDTLVFSALSFDFLYFTSENCFWIKHLFRKMPHNCIKKILRDSIYAHECRIKMHVIQSGPSELTLYKCDSCQAFIDENNLYKHAENSCFKLRKHLCPSCGLAFISSDACSKHALIHIKQPNINSKSYRIITFNRTEDKKLNKILCQRSNYYVLYQCRNCFGVVDQPQTTQHECNPHNLNKCKKCDLLILADDLNLHYKRHEELLKFSQRNIKIILFSDVCQTSANANFTRPSYKGRVFDYTLFSCADCNICTNQYVNISRHKCAFGKCKISCSQCNLNFIASEMKIHLKLHETDLDFVRGNMRIITFASTSSVDGNSSHLTESNDDAIKQLAKTSICDRENNVIVECQENTSSVLYRCKCGIKFLEDDVTAMAAHLRSCNSDMMKIN